MGKAFLVTMRKIAIWRCSCSFMVVVVVVRSLSAWQHWWHVLNWNDQTIQESYALAFPCNSFASLKRFGRPVPSPPLNLALLSLTSNLRLSGFQASTWLISSCMMSSSTFCKFHLILDNLVLNSFRWEALVILATWSSSMRGRFVSMCFKSSVDDWQASYDLKLRMCSYYI